MNITLSIDEKVADAAREAAKAMGKSLNQVVRDHLQHLAGSAQIDAEIAEYRRSTALTPGRRRGWKFDRDELNSRA
ncbi:MAG: DUF6364 family protein [Burkholderiales bacterium]